MPSCSGGRASPELICALFCFFENCSRELPNRCKRRVSTHSVVGFQAYRQTHTAFQVLAGILPMGTFRFPVLDKVEVE